MGNINRVRMALRAFKRRGNQDQPKTVLGVSPSRTTSYGTPSLIGWIWETPTLDEASKACSRFLRVFASRGQKIAALKRAGWKVDCVLFLELKGEASGGGPSFSPKVLGALGRLSIPVWIDVYVLPRTKRRRAP